MNYSKNKRFDAIESIIFQDGLSLMTVDIHPEMDLLTIYFDAKEVLGQRVSYFKLLKGTEKSKLLKCELIGNGIGVS